MIMLMLLLNMLMMLLIMLMRMTIMLTTMILMLMLMITLMLLMILTMMGIKFIDKHDSLAKVLDFAKSTKPIKLLQRDKN